MDGAMFTASMLRSVTECLGGTYKSLSLRAVCKSFRSSIAAPNHCTDCQLWLHAIKQDMVYLCESLSIENLSIRCDLASLIAKNGKKRTVEYAMLFIPINCFCAIKDLVRRGDFDIIKSVINSHWQYSMEMVLRYTLEYPVPTSHTLNAIKLFDGSWYKHHSTIVSESAGFYWEVHKLSRDIQNEKILLLASYGLLDRAAYFSNSDSILFNGCVKSLPEIDWMSIVGTGNAILLEFAITAPFNVRPSKEQMLEMLHHAEKNNLQYIVKYLTNNP